MHVSRLETCCGCISLKTGVIIIAALQTIESAGSILLYYIQPKLFLEYSYDLSENDHTLMLILILISNAFSIILSLLLMAGAKQGKVKLMVPWVYITLLALALWTGMFTYSFLMIVTYNISQLSMLLIPFLNIALSAYFWLVVHSYYKKLKGEESPGHIIQYTEKC